MIISSNPLFPLYKVFSKKFMVTEKAFNPFPSKPWFLHVGNTSLL